MFEDFNQAGDRWKYFLYLLVKRLYEEENIPDSFFVTTLSALYKKGDPREPSNYRYIHIRRPESRLLELAIYGKLAKTYDEETDESQLGGMPGCSMVEHLTTLMSVINEKEEKKEGLIVTFQDVVKCFDNIHLSDMTWFLIEGKADLKAKMQAKLTNTNVLKIQGSDKTFSVTNGLGQGSVNAARMASGGKVECFKKNMEEYENKVIHNEVNVTMNSFVDDAMFMNEDPKGAKESGEVITRTLNELALHAHPQKTVQVIVGAEENIEKMKIKLEEEPTKVQNFTVKEAKADGYSVF